MVCRFGGDAMIVNGKEITEEEFKKLIHQSFISTPIPKEMPKDRWHQIPAVKVIKKGSKEDIPDKN